MDELYFVGIGASAGGLEALESLFKAMPDDTGLTFIVVQHLSPDYKSLMNELLARHTNMEIFVIEDGMKAEPNKVYLIPPRKNLSVFHGVLYLHQHEDQQRNLFLPIDIFFKSLAKDQEKKAIGIILSGTGSDGTLGVRAIKDAGGMVMVQEEKTAKFDGMPKSSIATGLVDYILPPHQMPEELMNYTKHPSIMNHTTKKNDPNENVDDITKICMILRNYGSIDFSKYKSSTIIRRIERRVAINKIESIEKYIQFLIDSNKEKEVLERELLIGVTGFFRDKEAYESLEKNVLPYIDYSKKVIRIWSAACSTGEEVYSLAILFSEYIEKNNINCDLKFFATDVDSKALEIAGAGYYPESLIADIAPALLTKYFDVRNDGYQIGEKIRKLVVFAKHNLLKDPPFSKLDLLVCRNFFIYLRGNVQQDILKGFYYSVQSKGFLFMGSSESIGEMADGFEPIDNKWKIYKYKDGYKPSIGKLVMTGDTNTKLHSGESERHRNANGIRYEQLLLNVLEKKIQPSIIIDSSDNIIQIIGDASEYIHPQPGRFSNNFNRNMPNEMALFVNNILRRLRMDKKDIKFSNISFSNYNESFLTITGTLVNVHNTEFYLVSFMKEELKPLEPYVQVDMTQDAKNQVRQLETELQIAREGLQATIEELETSNEELQSSNEELIASNEELQSTNEELQSVNEELYTVNNEHQSKIDDLIKLNNDLNNLMKNTEIGAMYIDSNMCIRKITPIVAKVTRVMESDIGRPIAHIQVIPEYPELVNDIYQTMDTLLGSEREIYLENGKIYLAKLRPYRTEYNSIEGVILTLVNITNLKSEQFDNEKLNRRLSDVLKMGAVGWWEYNVKTGQVNYSDSKATMIGYDAAEFPKDVYEICSYIHPDDFEATMKAMKDYIDGESNEWNVTYRIRRKDGSYAIYHDIGQITEFDDKGKAVRLIGTVLDISNK